MTKAELIEGLANKLNLNKAEAEKAVNLLLDDIVTALKQGDRVNISGFGTFSVSERASRVGRNPKTGEAIQISASRSAKFRAGSSSKTRSTTSSPVAARKRVRHRPSAARGAAILADRRRARRGAAFACAELPRPGPHDVCMYCFDAARGVLDTLRVEAAILVSIEGGGRLAQR